MQKSSGNLHCYVGQFSVRQKRDFQEKKETARVVIGGLPNTSRLTAEGCWTTIAKMHNATNLLEFKIRIRLIKASNPFSLCVALSSLSMESRAHASSSCAWKKNKTQPEILWEKTLHTIASSETSRFVQMPMSCVLKDPSIYVVYLLGSLQHSIRDLSLLSSKWSSILVAVAVPRLCYGLNWGG